ncbi:unnamed protein product [Mucor circinelloides]
MKNMIKLQLSIIAPFFFIGTFGFAIIAAIITATATVATSPGQQSLVLHKSRIRFIVISKVITSRLISRRLGTVYVYVFILFKLLVKIFGIPQTSIMRGKRRCHYCQQRNHSRSRR